MKPRYRFTMFVLLIASVLLAGVFFRVIPQTRDKPASVAAVKTEEKPTPINVSTSDLIQLNEALSMQQQAYARREKALGDLYNSMTDLEKSSVIIQKISATLPKGAEPTRDDSGKIIGFTLPVRPATRP